MNRLRRFYSAAIGKKIVMGVTGLIGIGFVILHMAGNLLLYKGAEALNHYAELLQSKAADDRAFEMTSLTVDPRLESIRESPEYHAVVRRLGLP